MPDKAIIIKMYNMEKILDIVNENDEIIGQASREEIHRDGLKHREIHVYFITPDKEIIFQLRAKDKDLYPDFLDATVGGHVESSETYLDAAIREAEEETGLTIKPTDLIFVGKNSKREIDEATGKINNVINESYVYIFNGKKEDLKIEKGKSQGFEFWSFDRLDGLSDSEKKRFIPYILNFVKEKLKKSSY